MDPLRTDQQSGVRYRAWNAANPRAVVVAIHGLGAHSARWHCLAEFLSAQGIALYGIELRGFGETAGRRGDCASFSFYYKDILALISIVRREHPNKKIFLLGESMGGVLASVVAQICSCGENTMSVGAATSPPAAHLCRAAGCPPLQTPALSGLILISPAFKSILPFRWTDYFAIGLWMCIYPKKTILLPLAPWMITRDLLWQKSIEEDPFGHRLATIRFLIGLLVQQRYACHHACAISLPILFLIAGDDKIVDTIMSRKVYDRLTTPDKTFIQYTEMYHALSIDENRDDVFADIVSWLRKR